MATKEDVEGNAQQLEAQADEIETLKQQLRELMQNRQPKGEVKMSPSRKLTKFNGSNHDVKDWVEVARGVIIGLNPGEQLQFVLRHLESTA